MYSPETFLIDDEINTYQPTFNITEAGSIVCLIDGEVLDNSKFSVTLDEVNWLAIISLNEEDLGEELTILRNPEIFTNFNILGYGKNNIKDLEKTLYNLIINIENLRYLIDYFIAPDGSLVWKVATTESPGYFKLSQVLTPNKLLSILETEEKPLQDLKKEFEDLYKRLTLINNDVVVSNKVLLEVCACPKNSDVYSNKDFYLKQETILNKEDYPEAFDKIENKFPEWLIDENNAQLPKLNISNNTVEFYYAVKIEQNI